MTLASSRLARQSELVGRTEADAEEHRVVIAAQLLERHVAAERDAVLHRDPAGRQDEGDFARGEVVGRLVGGDAVFVEAARFLALLEDRRLVAGDGERVGAGQSRRTGADDRDALAGRRGAAERRLAGRHLRVDRVALQQADSHRLALGRLAHAGFLAQGLGRADARAHAAHDVGVENRFGGAERVAGGDLANEERNVDRGRTGALAGRVVAEVAAVGLDLRLMGGERRMQVGEIVAELGAVEAARLDVGDPPRFGNNSHSGPPRAKPRAVLRQFLTNWSKCSPGFSTKSSIHAPRRAAGRRLRAEATDRNQTSARRPPAQVRGLAYVIFSCALGFASHLSSFSPSLRSQRREALRPRSGSS